MGKDSNLDDEKFFDLLDEEDDKDKKESSDEKGEDESTSQTDSDEDDKDDTDFRELYVNSQKEFQKKYRPMEKQVKALQEKTGKNLEELLESESEPTEDESKSTDETSSDQPEIGDVLKKVEELEGVLTDRVKRDTNEKVDKFLAKRNVEREFYEENIVPHLKGIKDMVNPETGDPYPFEEGLEIALDIAQRKDRIAAADKKRRAEDAEKGLANAPSGGSGATPKDDSPSHSKEQLDVANQMGVDLSEEKKQ